MKKLVLATLLLFPLSAEAGLEEGIAALEGRDYQNAYAHFHPLAVAGDPEAQFRLCGMYYMGMGLPQNHFEALQWCSYAANQGHVEAMYNLGLFFHKGEGTTKNTKEAIYWYDLAAKQGHRDAEFNLLTLMNEQRYAQQAATRQAIPPQYQLAPQGQPRNAAGYPAPQGYPAPNQIVPQPRPQYRPAVPAQIPAPQYPPQVRANTSPPPKRQYTIADMQKLHKQQSCLDAAQRGIIAENCQDDYYSKPTEESQEQTNTNETEEVSKDVKWFLNKAKKGDLQAQNNLGVMYRRGKGVQKDAKKAFEWFEKSAAKGSTNAMLNLASMYKLGEGIDQNLELAYSWYNLAADRSIEVDKKEKAQENIKELSTHLTNEQIGNALEYINKLDESIPLAN